MKYLVMCEGSNELEVVRILLANNRLIFGEDDLLGLTPYHARQIDNNAQVRTELNMYPGNDVCVIRIGDKQSDKLRIPEEYKGKIVAVNKYCTKPELEMLLIINECLVSEYEKVKSETSPKAFAKRYICCGRKRYDNSSKFYHDYYSGECDKLVNALYEYKRSRGAHQKDELYLADLLRV